MDKRAANQKTDDVPQPPSGGDGVDEGCFSVCGQSVAPGGRQTVEVTVSELYNGDPLLFRVVVIRGKSAGPTLFIMAALHGDELVGVEVVRRLAQEIDPEALCGTLLLVPVGSPFGLLHRSRYMPDRGDLNRSFPGKGTGSPTARMAHFLMQEVVGRCDYGIELHTAAARRRNLPQIRAELRHPAVRRLATAFGCPHVIASAPPKKSLRGSVDPAKTSVILYEAGEILRIDEACVSTGHRGCLNVLREVGMLPSDGSALLPPASVFHHTTWVRAEQGGLLRPRVELGQRLCAGEVIAGTMHLLGSDQRELRCPREGVVIGLTTMPLVNPGDAVCHLAW